MSVKKQIIEDLLEKHRQSLTKEGLAYISQFSKANQVKSIPLWKMDGVMRFFCQAARLQVYLYGVASLGYLMYAIKNKWDKGEDAQRRIMILGPLITIGSLAAIRVSMLLTRILVKEINYMPETNQLALKFYTNLFTTRQYAVKPTEILPLEKKKRFQAVNYIVEPYNRKFTTQVLGQWTNKRLFNHLIGGGTLYSEPVNQQSFKR